MLKKTMVVVLGIILGGCATQPIDPQIVEYSNKPVHCVDKTQCDEYWSRAQVWVSQASKFRIQIATDNIIETYGPGDPLYYWLAYSVSRMPDGHGGAAIDVQARCALWSGCKSDVIAGRASSKLYIEGRAPTVIAPQ